MAPPFDLADLPTGVAMPLSPMVARVLAPNPSPFTFTGTQTYVVGSSDVAVIDPGPDEADHLTALTAAIAGRPVVAIVCTHTHRDHSPAAQPLRAMTGAPVIGCAPLTLDDDGPRADAAFDAAYRPDRILADGERLAGEGWTLEAVATPGHTSNHLCFALVEEQALFTGDHVMGWSTSVISPPDGDMADYMRSMQRLLERQDTIYYPAHGEPIDNPQRLVRGMIGHRKQREGQILRFLERNGDSLIPDMVAEMYKGVDPRLHPAAGRSVLAHLIDLHQRGLVMAADDLWQMR
ncbi:MAG: MBL fold metallo-hydrolase [Sphingobium sp.]|uniref:MBL fold metallo-hydrolase n=1 Tax=Sphingobium sp. TaxID=1912891 RepID=UPI00121199ED|nr:MBL fold metallo-hydrolase [Sphingobium sp.]MBU0658167.1 MBL fold metallo-hydrolase [Alphaproteobacteria bacterium]MBA4755214.1 MBL fold metallo-hydrolase [Sphingobium sp.]MBU0776270.1 MBL fold metallo-hydrolase [Alphaproteobacteria bacterium]MBU0868163.1 MBL fold metallo-hydrolase [Alphaproteobacteria bacterium]MBU1796385.1 MBL fold metallo-hydrolase [Alphaproteobacteria bacterium]